MKDITSSVFDEEDKIELEQWLRISRKDLNALISSSDRHTLRRLHTLEGKDSVMEALLHNVWMKHIMPDMSKIPGGCVADGNMPGFDLHVDPKVWPYLHGFDHDDLIAGFVPQNNIICIEKALTSESCDEVKAYYLSQGQFSPVGVQGMAGGDDKVGSNRITCWDNEFAREMFIAVHSALDGKTCNQFTATDWWQASRNEEFVHVPGEYHKMVKPVSKHWRPVGVTPMVRFMNYQAGGEHYAHYDAGYIYDNPRYRTLMSGVLYLTSNSSGATRFVKDDQERFAIWERTHLDHQERTPDENVQRIFYPDKGTILLFDHRLCHDVQLYNGKEGDRTIIRFDVVFEATDITE